jgi:hypothetical protein
VSVEGYWANGHYKRSVKVDDPRVDRAYIHFYAAVATEIGERPTIWQRVVMALQGWWWHDGKPPVAGDNPPT